MPEQPLVSVIIPLYNAERYIEQCVNSILAQTWPNIEVIIINDGSTDNSLAIARKFESEKVNVLSQPNCGASVARNHGLKVAKGEYIQFMDADDLLSKNKIEEQVIILEKNKDCIAVCDTVYFPDGTDPYQYSPVTDWYVDGSDNPADFLIKLYGGHFIGKGYGGMVQPNAWLTPRSLIDKAGLWTEMRCPDDDGEFFCRVILSGKGICYVPGALNYYRKFDTQKSLSGQKTYAACKSILKATDLKASHLLSNTNDDRAKLALGRLYWEHAFSFYPQYKDLAKEAETKAKGLAPQSLFRPYNLSLKLFLSKIIGWKAVRYLQFLNQKRHSQ
jgi:glycosyltransferase involved in cell wall biosynthesis